MTVRPAPALLLTIAVGCSGEVDSTSTKGDAARTTIAGDTAPAGDTSAGDTTTAGDTTAAGDTSAGDTPTAGDTTTGDTLAAGDRSAGDTTTAGDTDRGDRKVGDPGPPVCAGFVGDPPQQLVFPAEEPNGSFDASLARDPTTGRLYASYSGVTGPVNAGHVSNHLAYSDDGGRTWCHMGVVSASEDIGAGARPPALALDPCHWNHEVPALAHDPGAPANERWKLIWTRWLVVGAGGPGVDGAHFEYSWIAIRAAPTVEGLFFAPERKLFAGSAYYAFQTYNDAVIGPPEVQLTSLDASALDGCVFVIEPGAHATAGALHLSLPCAASDGTLSVVLLSLDHAGGGWSYVATPLTFAHAQAINATLAGFSATDLSWTGSSHLLLATPLVQNGGGFRGCLGYEIDLTDGSIPDLTGDGPDISVVVPASPGFSGACTYDAGATTSGILFGEVQATAPSFRMIATGQLP